MPSDRQYSVREELLQPPFFLLIQAPQMVAKRRREWQRRGIQDQDYIQLDGVGDDGASTCLLQSQYAQINNSELGLTAGTTLRLIS